MQLYLWFLKLAKGRLGGRCFNIWFSCTKLPVWVWKTDFLSTSESQFKFCFLIKDIVRSKSGERSLHWSYSIVETDTVALAQIHSYLTPFTSLWQGVGWCIVKSLWTSPHGYKKWQAHGCLLRASCSPTDDNIYATQTQERPSKPADGETRTHILVLLL